MVGVLVLNHWTVEEILQEYQLTQPQLVGLLTRLDRLRLIDLLPGQSHQDSARAQLQLAQGRPDPALLRRACATTVLRLFFSGPRRAAAHRAWKHLAARQRPASATHAQARRGAGCPSRRIQAARPALPRRHYAGDCDPAVGAQPVY